MDRGFAIAQGYCIRDHSPGWEHDWLALCDDDLVPALHRISRTLCRWRRDEDRLQAVQEVIDLYQERAVTGALLATWDESRGTPAGFLTGDVAQGRLIRAAMRAQLHSYSLDEPTDQINTETKMSDVVAAPAVDPQADHAIQVMSHLWGDLHLATFTQVTRLHEVTGAQLFTAIVWDVPPAPTLAQRMPGFLAQVPSDDWRTVLTVRLAQARDRLQARIEDHLVDLHSTSTRLQSEAASQIADLRRQHLLQPLDVDDLTDLTGAARDACYQWLSRYRKALPDLIVEVGQAARSWLTDSAPGVISP